MMKRRIWKRWGLILLCLLTLAGLVSCSFPARDVDGLSERFLECVLADDYESAYRMVQSTVGNEEFSAYWQEIRLVAEGAEQYEIEKRSLDTGTADGALYATATYLIHFDNGRIATLRITARSDYPDIAGIHFSDATDFLERTQTTVSVLDKVLLGARILSILFAAWMFVECLRSRIRCGASSFAWGPLWL